MVSKYIYLAAFCFCALFFTGCRANAFKTPFKPQPGIFFTQYKIPLTVPDKTLSVEGLKKVGEKSFYFSWHYPEFEMAATLDKKSYQKLTEIHYADLEVITIFSFIGFYKVNYYGKELTPQR